MSCRTDGIHTKLALIDYVLLCCVGFVDRSTESASDYEQEMSQS